MTWSPPPYDPGSDFTRVCWTHGAVNACRTGCNNGGGLCEWRTDSASVRAVVEYQEERREDWRV